MPEQLILSVVSGAAGAGHVAKIRLVLHMSALVVVPVADGGEPLEAVLAHVRLLSGVDPLMNLQVAPLVEYLVAQDILAVLFTDDLSANELLFVLFAFLAWTLELFLPLVNSLPLIYGKLLFMLSDLHVLALHCVVIWLEVFEVLVIKTYVFQLLKKQIAVDRLLVILIIETWWTCLNHEITFIGAPPLFFG